MECHILQCCANSIVYPPFCVYYPPVSHLQSQNGHLCWKCFAVPNGRRFAIFLRSETRLQRWSQQKWIDNWSVETSFPVTQHSLPREHTLRQIYVQAIILQGCSQNVICQRNGENRCRQALQPNFCAVTTKTPFNPKGTLEEWPQRCKPRSVNVVRVFILALGGCY